MVPRDIVRIEASSRDASYHGLRNEKSKEKQLRNQQATSSNVCVCTTDAAEAFEA